MVCIGTAAVSVGTFSEVLLLSSLQDHFSKSVTTNKPKNQHEEESRPKTKTTTYDYSEDDISNAATNAQQQSLCSSWKTFGNLGGRVVMDDTQVQRGWKGSTKITEKKCADAVDCYPFLVKVQGVDSKVEPGVHSFTITSLFARDEFHVALEGPELSPTFIEAHGNGTYTASYCVELPGFYKLYVRILQINSVVSLRKNTYKSPFSIHVQGKANHPNANTTNAPVARASVDPTKASLQPSLAKAPTELSDASKRSEATRAMNACTTARQATQGRWVRFDQAVRYNLLPSFELRRWHEVLEISKDEYVWLPYSCRLRPMNLDDIRVLLQNRTHCACCDSYIRTLFQTIMYSLGIFDKNQMKDTTEVGKLIHKNWEFEGTSMSWHDNKNFETCLEKSPNGLAVENILTEKVDKIRVASHAATVNNSSGKFVFFVGHPWSGDDRRSKRSNYAIQQAQKAVFTELGSEIDIFDALAFTFPRIYHDACDGSHVSCINSDQPSLLSFWEILILAQIL